MDYSPKIGVVPPAPTVTRGQRASLDISSDGCLVLYCAGKNVVIRDIHDSKKSLIYNEHTCKVTVAKFSPNMRYVASGDESGKIRVWAYKNVEHILVNEINCFPGAISDINWGPDNQRIIASGMNGSFLKGFMAETGSGIGDMTGHTSPTLTCDFKPSRPFRVVSGDDRRVCFWSGPPFRFTHSNTLHSKFINSIRFSPDGSKFASVSTDRKIFLYDGKSGEMIEEFPAPHEGAVYCCVWSPDSKMIATCSADKTVRIWNVEMKEFRTITFGESLDFMQLAVAWKKDVLVSVSLNGDINFINIEEGVILRKWEAQQFNLSTVAYLNEADVIISGSTDGQILTHSKMDEDTRLMKCDGSIIKVVPLANKRGFAWIDLKNHVGVCNDVNASPHIVTLKSMPRGLCLMDEYLAIATKDSVVQLSASGDILASFATSFEVTCIDYKNEIFALGCDKGFVHFMKIDGGILVEVGKSEECHRAAIACVAFSGDGDHLIAGDNEKEIRMYNAHSFETEVAHRMRHHGSRITDLAWCPDSSRFASCSVDANIVLWNPESILGVKKILRAHTDCVRALSWTSNEELVSVGHDYCVRYWDVKSL